MSAAPIRSPRVQTADAVAARDDLASLAVAIGLGIAADMRALNLLPAPRVEHRQDGSQSRLRSTNGIAAAAGAVLVLVTVLLALGFVQGRSDVNDRRTTFDRLDAQIAQEPADASLSAAAAAQAQAQLAAFTAASSGRAAWDNLLDQLARVMPRRLARDSAADAGCDEPPSPTNHTRPAPPSRRTA